MPDIELPELYLKTEVSIEEGGRLVSARDSSLVAAEVVHIITAWNPGDARPSRDENDNANRRLFDRLESLRCKPVRALGSDPDSDHFEESWAIVGLSDVQARAIGAEFGQVAVFRLSSLTQTVIACIDSWERSRGI
jgi:hypothetical protein